MSERVPEMPDRVWLERISHGGGDLTEGWDCFEAADPPEDDGGTEYIRADLHAEATKRVAELEWERQKYVDAHALFKGGLVEMRKQRDGLVKQKVHDALEKLPCYEDEMGNSNCPIELNNPPDDLLCPRCSQLRAMQPKEESKP